MKIKFLGTGTSTGIPEIGCKCEVCTSTDIKNRRLRASVLLRINDKRILIDCGPDFRQQMITEPFSKLDGVLLTHEHYDHVGGLDDLRPFCKFDDIDIYSNKITLDALQKRMPYSFADNKYPGVPTFKLHTVGGQDSFYINDIEIRPINLMHYRLPILGYRIGNFAYLTDVKSIPEEEYRKLENLDVLVINALRKTEHVSHLTLDEAIENSYKINPKKTYLIHMSHQLGLHEEVESHLPDNIFLSYDNLEIEM